jgi:hypothetical protein
MLIVAQAIAKADRRAGRPPEVSARGLKDRIIRLRRKLVTSGPEGAELCAAVTQALTGGGGRILRMAERSHVSMRGYVERAGTLLAAFVIGEGMRTPLALVRAGSAAMNQSMADLLRDLAVGLDPMVGMAVTKSRKLDDGSHLQHTVPTFDTLSGWVLKYESQATKDTLAARDLEMSARAEARQRELLERQRAWSRPTPALPTTTTTPTIIDQDQDVPGGDLISSLPVDEHGANPEADLPLSTASGFADDVSATPSVKPSPRAPWEQESPTTPETDDDGLDPEDVRPELHPDDVQAWDVERGRMVPFAWVRDGRRPPAARDGTLIVQRREQEKRDLLEWEMRIRQWSNALHAWEQRRSIRKAQRRTRS